MASFKRASVVLMNNSGSLYQKNYSLVLNVNPRFQRRANATDSKAPADKKPAAPAPRGVSYKSLTIGVPREVLQNERRVALTPGVAQNLTKKGFNVLVEENAGLQAKFSNEQYEQAGAKVVNSKNVFAGADILLKVRAPTIAVRNSSF
jgi:NAD(P) transhydrogenase